VWQPAESGVPRTTHSRRSRRQVLHPTHSLRQARFGETWSAGQHLSCNTSDGIDNFYPILCRAGGHSRSRWYRCQQQNGRQPWANGLSQPIQRRQRRRRVLVPGYSGDRMSPVRMPRGTQNPSKHRTSPSKNAFDSRSIASRRWTTSRHSRFQQQKGGSLLGGSGVRHTYGSRHPRRQVLVPIPDHSMSLGWNGVGWNRMGSNGNQNPTNRYRIGTNIPCDSSMLLGDLASTAGRPFPSQEVGR